MHGGHSGDTEDRGEETLRHDLSHRRHHHHSPWRHHLCHGHYLFNQVCCMWVFVKITKQNTYF